MKGSKSVNNFLLGFCLLTCGVAAAEDGWWQKFRTNGRKRVQEIRERRSHKNDLPVATSWRENEDSAPAKSAQDKSHFKVFRLSTPQVFALGENPSNFQLPMKDSLVQMLPNITGSGNLCQPPFMSENKAPCDADQLLISFIRHRNDKNLVPARGTCFCISNNLLPKEDRENQHGTSQDPNNSLRPIAIPSPDDLNVFDYSNQHLFNVKNDDGKTVSVPDSMLYVRDFES